jgi:hypothetical protein
MDDLEVCAISLSRLYRLISFCTFPHPFPVHTTPASLLPFGVSVTHKHLGLYIFCILITVEQFGDPRPGTQPDQDRHVQGTLYGGFLGDSKPYRHRHTLNRIQNVFREEHHSLRKTCIDSSALVG